MTELIGFEACRLDGSVAICWCSDLWIEDAVGGLIGMYRNRVRAANLRV
jgi:hypothetical protein